MMLDESETVAAFELLPEELRMHIVSYLDTPSLCFFAATSQRSLGNALAELQKRKRQLLAQIQLGAKGIRTFCYTLHSRGDNEYGRLRQRYCKNHNQLRRVEKLPGTILQVVGGNYHTVVLTDQGLYARGNNGHGELGLGHKNECHQLTRIENVLGTILQVAVGDYHTVVLTDQGLYACGYNVYGQLGLGHTNPCYKLTRVEELPGTILQVAAGNKHTVVLTEQGLYACGWSQPSVDDEKYHSTFTPISQLPADLKHWFSIVRHINHLITISTKHVVSEQADENEVPPTTTRTRFKCIVG